MPSLLTCSEGVGVRDPAGHVRLLDVPYTDLGDALRDGVSLHELSQRSTRSERKFEDLVLLPPVTRPSKIWAQGLAYRGSGQEVRHAPRVFLVAPSALIGSGKPVRLPRGMSSEIDYEGEVALVVGQRCKDVPIERVWEVLAGITICNDVTARAVQRGEIDGVVDTSLASSTLGKSFDTFKPLGPAVVTIDDFSDRDAIRLETYVDGEQRQQASTDTLIFSIPELVSYLSTRTTLEPGDVISTGSPTGIGVTTGRFLSVGSTMRVVIPEVGALENWVEEPLEEVASIG